MHGTDRDGGDRRATRGLRTADADGRRDRHQPQRRGEARAQLIAAAAGAGCGEQVQIDIKKLGRIPPGGGWRAWGCGNVVESRATKAGYAFIHTAIDSHTRLAYGEVLGDEKAITAIGFWERAHTWFAALGIRIEVAQTDTSSLTAVAHDHGLRPGLRPPGGRDRPGW